MKSSLTTHEIFMKEHRPTSSRQVVPNRKGLDLASTATHPAGTAVGRMSTTPGGRTWDRDRSLHLLLLQTTTGAVADKLYVMGVNLKTGLSGDLSPLVVR